MLPRVCLLRSASRVASLLQCLQEKDLEAFALETIRIDPVSFVRPDFSDFDAILVTSANAVMQAKSIMMILSKGLMPIYAIGEATQQALFDAGCQKVVLAETRDGEGLVKTLLSSQGSIRQVLLLTGEGGAQKAQQMLEESHVRYHELIVYRRVPADCDFNRALSPLPDVILVPSVDALRFFFEGLNIDQQVLIRRVPLLCYSERIQLAAQMMGFSSLHLAESFDVSYLCGKLSALSQSIG